MKTWRRIFGPFGWFRWYTVRLKGRTRWYCYTGTVRWFYPALPPLPAETR